MSSAVSGAVSGSVSGAMSSAVSSAMLRPDWCDTTVWGRSRRTSRGDVGGASRILEFRLVGGRLWAGVGRCKCGGCGLIGVRAAGGRWVAWESQRVDWARRVCGLWRLAGRGSRELHGWARVQGPKPGRWKASLRCAA